MDVHCKYTWACVTFAPSWLSLIDKWNLLKTLIGLTGAHLYCEKYYVPYESTSRKGLRYFTVCLVWLCISYTFNLHT